MSKYIAVRGLTNTIGIGIVEIDHSQDTLRYEVFTDHIEEGGEAPIIQQFNSDTDEYESGFFIGLSFQSLGEFIRTDY